MTEKRPTYSINEAFEYAQKIKESYLYKPGSPEREFVNCEDANRYAITLLKEKGTWRYSDSQYSFQVENALITLYDHVGHEVKSMYRMLETLDKFEDLCREACRIWIPDYAERLKQLHYDLNGGGLWLSESYERRFSDTRVRLWELRETLDVLAAYKAKVEQEGFECFYLHPADNVSLNGLFNKSQENGKSEAKNVSEPYFVIQNRYDPVEGWQLLGYLEVEETVKSGSSQNSTPHKVSSDILFHTPSEKLRILSGVPMNLSLLPNSAPIMSGVRTIHGILDTVGKKLWSNGLFVAYPKE